jgi:hypothetical protein
LSRIIGELITHQSIWGALNGVDPISWTPHSP